MTIITNLALIPPEVIAKVEAIITKEEINPDNYEIIGIAVNEPFANGVRIRFNTYESLGIFKSEIDITYGSSGLNINLPGFCTLTPNILKSMDCVAFAESIEDGS